MRILPNILTFFRILLIPIVILFFYLGFYFNENYYFIISAILFWLAGITDYLDGYIARKWKLQSNLGMMLDPIADKLLIASIILVLVDRGQAHVIPAIIIICREILISGLREFLADLKVSVPVSKLAKYKTLVQMLSLFLLLMSGNFNDSVIKNMGNATLWIAAILSIITAFNYLKLGIKKIEP